MRSERHKGSCWKKTYDRIMHPKKGIMLLLCGGADRVNSIGFTIRSCCNSVIHDINILKEKNQMEANIGKIG